MKLSVSSFLALVVGPLPPTVVSAASWKGYRRLGRFKEAKRQGIQPAYDEDTNDRDLEFIPEQADSADPGPSEGMFTPAQSLGYFRNMNDEVFKWYNKKHIQPGATTCGDLYAPLGSQEGEPYPKVRVKFCMRFAEIQPAPKGNIGVHCGGPSSGSECILDFAGPAWLGEENTKNYNIFAFDQRGLGMSWPTFAHRECSYPLVENEDGTLSKAPGSLNPDEIDYANATQVFSFLDQQKKRRESCWTCETCDFIMEATDGSGRTYHFLDYSGTRQAGEDIDRFRQAIGAEKISVYGVSYGTLMFANYATQFPDKVDKFVIDSTMPPLPDLLNLGTDMARFNHQRISYMFFTCTVSGACPFNPEQCFQAIYNFAHENGYPKEVFDSFLNDGFTGLQMFDTIGQACLAVLDDDEFEFIDALVQVMAAAEGEPFPSCLEPIFRMFAQVVEEQEVELPDTTLPVLAFLLTMETTDNQTCTDFIDLDSEPDSQKQLVEDLFFELFEAVDEARKRQANGLDLEFCSGPTLAYEPFGGLVVQCADGNFQLVDENYLVVQSNAQTEFQMITAQSLYGSTYDDVHVYEMTQDMFQRYGGGYLGNSAAQQFMLGWSIGYWWPQSQPIASCGDPTITGIVSGQLYDYATPYKWTQEMKMAFPLTHLITSQWTQHGLSVATAGSISDGASHPACDDLIKEYLATGHVSFVDGHVCGAPLPSAFDGDFAARR